MIVFKMHQKGFSLIELMITVAIIGILSSIAYPSYIDYIIDSRRADAQQALTAFATTMERYRAENGTYNGAAAGGGNTGSPRLFPTQTPVDGGSPYYDVTIQAAGANSFVLRATPVAGSSQDGDGFLEIDSSGLKGWDSDNSGALSDDEYPWSN